MPPKGLHPLLLESDSLQLNLNDAFFHRPKQTQEFPLLSRRYVAGIKHLHKVLIKRSKSSPEIFMPACIVFISRPL